MRSPSSPRTINAEPARDMVGGEMGMVKEYLGWNSLGGALGGVLVYWLVSGAGHSRIGPIVAGALGRSNVRAVTGGVAGAH